MASGKIKISNLLNALIRPEKCPACQQWMDVYKTYNDGHEILERQCVDCGAFQPPKNSNQGNQNVQKTSF